jgi:uncharacterized iron-regulated membrane protein
VKGRNRPVSNGSADGKSLRQSMSSLHTWAGLLPGWLLFLIFLFGTAAFFQQEISRWMRPELRSVAVTSTALDQASAYLAKKAPDASSWTVILPPERGGEPLSLSWKTGDDGKPGGGKATLDPATGRELAVRDTRGGFFLYRFHFDLHYMPVMWARYMVCIAALAMLVAILSGVVTHKKIFADFFLLRFGKGQRSWLDAHNVTAVLSLPFHLMMTYTGLVTLLFTLMPWAISVNFPDRASYYDAAFPEIPEPKAVGVPTPMLPLSTLAARAQAAANFRLSAITLLNPGDASAIMEARVANNRITGAERSINLDAVNGAVLPAMPAIGDAQRTQRVMVALHAGRFASPTLRWLYFLSGVGGTIMIATGLVLWTVKRRPRLADPARPHFGFRLVERLNIGVIAGASGGIAAYFLANRLLPLDVTDRAAWEINALFIAWGGMAVWTLARPAKRAWIESLAICGGLYALVPAVNALTPERGLVTSLIAHDWVFVGFDLVMLALAAACAFTAWKVASHGSKAASRREMRELVEAAI